MDDVLWKLEQATAAKHILYKRYLDAWWPIMLQPVPPKGYSRPRVTYVDAFAGPGEYADGEDGSPIFALERLLNHVARDRMDLRQSRACLIFIEKDRRRYEHLLGKIRKRFGDIDKLPVWVVVRHGEAATETAAALTQTRAWGKPILAIFDSWGNVNVPFGLVKQIAQNKSSEVITTFGPNWFSRREKENPEQLDEVFGGRTFWQAADRETRPDERWRVWLETYRQSLVRAGFPYQLKFEVVPKTGQPLNLVFGTSSDKGVEAMKDAMWKVDGVDGMSFRDPRTRGGALKMQMDLFAQAEQEDEVTELIMQRLGRASATLEEIREWLLCETSRWRRKDAQSAVASMIERGLAKASPQGRLTKASVVSLA